MNDLVERTADSADFAFAQLESDRVERLEFGLSLDPSEGRKLAYRLDAPPTVHCLLIEWVSVR